MQELTIIIGKLANVVAECGLQDYSLTGKYALYLEGNVETFDNKKDLDNSVEAYKDAYSVDHEVRIASV